MNRSYASASKREDGDGDGDGAVDVGVILLRFMEEVSFDSKDRRDDSCRASASRRW